MIKSINLFSQFLAHHWTGLKFSPVCDDTGKNKCFQSSCYPFYQCDCKRNSEPFPDARSGREGRWELGRWFSPAWRKPGGRINVSLHHISVHLHCPPYPLLPFHEKYVAGSERTHQFAFWQPVSDHVSFVSIAIEAVCFVVVVVIFDGLPVFPLSMKRTGQTLRVSDFPPA